MQEENPVIPAQSAIKTPSGMDNTQDGMTNSSTGASEETNRPSIDTPSPPLFGGHDSSRLMFPGMNQERRSSLTSEVSVDISNLALSSKPIYMPNQDKSNTLNTSREGRILDSDEIEEVFGSDEYFRRELLGHPVAIEAFRKFLIERHSVENLNFYLRVHEFSKNPELVEARAIFDEYIGPDAPLPVGVNPFNTEEIETTIQQLESATDKTTPHSNLFAKGLKEVYDYLKHDCFRAFFESSSYSEFREWQLAQRRRSQCTMLKSFHSLVNDTLGAICFQLHCDANGVGKLSKLMFEIIEFKDIAGSDKQILKLAKQICVNYFEKNRVSLPSAITPPRAKELTAPVSRSVFDVIFGYIESILETSQFPAFCKSPLATALVDISIPNIFHSKTSFPVFKTHCREMLCSENVMFCSAVIQYKKLPPSQRSACALEMYRDFISDSAETQVTLPMYIRKKLRRCIINEEFTSGIFDQAFKRITYTLKSDVFPRFLTSDLCLNFLKEVSQKK